MKRLLSLMLLYFFCSVGANFIIAQDFIFTEIPNPPGFEYGNFVTQTDDNTYLAYYDGNFQYYIYTFDGEVLTNLGGPDGFSYNFFLTEQEGNLYFSYNDPSFASALVRYDGTDFTVLGEPNYNEFLNSYSFSLDGTDYFSFFEFFNFTQILRYVDGDELIDVELPTGLNFGNYLGTINNEVLVTLQDLNFNQSLYSFDGNTFTELTLPPNTSNPFLLFPDDDGLYLNLYDSNFNSLLYFFDGVAFTQIELPADFGINSFIAKFNDKLYFNLFDNNFNGFLYELDGSDWTEIDAGNGYYLVFGGNATESAIHLAYTNDGFYTFTMGIFDGTNLEIVENPLGLQFGNYLTEWEDGLFARYYDLIFNSTLQYYANGDFQTVPPPAGTNFGDYAFQLDDLLYFTFFDASFDSKLYYLGEPNTPPSAADNTVQTLIETPYVFSIEEFNFSDLDPNDTLSAIQIVEKPTLGILHLNGANIGTGDYILASEIEDLTYVPFNEGMGMPYDFFRFKVFDGDDLSEETYTMFINVLEELVDTDNPLLAIKLNIYPNPATDFIRIDLENYQFQMDAEIIIFSQHGQLLERRTHPNNLEIFDVKSWNKGMYTVVIRDGKNIISRKIVVH